MKDTSLKIVVVLNEAFPDLVSDLAQVTPKLRAERMRALASLGLYAESGMMGGTTNLILSSSPLSRRVEGPPVVNQFAPGSIKFAVVLNEAVPVLYKALQSTPVRMRAERLKALASLGFHVQTSSGDSSIPQSVTQGVSPVVEDVGSTVEKVAGITISETAKQTLPKVETPLPPLTDLSDATPVKVNEGLVPTPVKASKKIAWLAKSLGS